MSAGYISVRASRHVKLRREFPSFFDALAPSARREALEQLLITCFSQDHDDDLAPLREWYAAYLAHGAMAPVGIESRDVFSGEMGLYDCPPLMVDHLSERLGFSGRRP